MNGKKVLTIITLGCFLFSFVCSEPLQAVVDLRAESAAAERFTRLPGELLIPQSCGRVTDFRSFGSRQVVVNIQDLHCHAEVQRNIAKILAALDKNRPLDRVYVEGGYGNIDTSWLGGIADKALRAEIIENLLEQGRLSGSEYYSVTVAKPQLLKGLEDEALHKANIVRLGRILDRQEFFKKKIKELDKDLEFMQARYMSVGNRRLNELIERHKEGKVPSEKYYTLLNRYVRDMEEHPDRYNNILATGREDFPNINTFLELNRLSKQLHYKRLSLQLQQFMQLLKSALPYSEYNALLAKTDNLSNLDELYICLARLNREHALGLAARFPELNKFLDYVDKSRSVNPVQMLQEERQLLETLRSGLARNTGELEVSFLTDFYGCFKDYLQNALSAGDYEYFTGRFDKFQRVWGRYAFRNRIADLSGDFPLLSEFYAVNCERNNRFLKNTALLAAVQDHGPAAQDVLPSNSLPDLKNTEIVVMVTGGFHTDGLKTLLQERKISYVTITPNVTMDARHAGELFARLAKDQAKIFSNALALGLASQLSSTRLIELAVKAANRKLEGVEPGKRDQLLQEIAKAAGTRMESDKNGIAEFSNGARIKLATKEGVLQVESVKPGDVAEKTVNAALDVLGGIGKLNAAVDMALAGEPDTFIELAAKVAAEHELFKNNALILAITRDQTLKDRETIDDIPDELLARFPVYLQMTAANREKFKESLQERGDWRQILLAVDLLREFLERGETLNKKAEKNVQQEKNVASAWARAHINELLKNSIIRDEIDELISDSWQRLLRDPDNTVFRYLSVLETAGVGRKPLERLIDTLFYLGIDVTDPWATSYHISDILKYMSKGLLGEDLSAYGNLVRDADFAPVTPAPKVSLRNEFDIPSDITLPELRRRFYEFREKQKQLILSQNDYADIYRSNSHNMDDALEKIVRVMLPRIWEELGIPADSSAVVYFRKMKSFASDFDLFYEGPRHQEVDDKLTEIFFALGMKRDVSQSFSTVEQYQRGYYWLTQFLFGGRAVEFNGGSFKKMYQQYFENRAEGKAMWQQTHLHLYRQIPLWRSDPTKVHFKESLYRNMTDLMFSLSMVLDVDLGADEERFFEDLKKKMSPEDVRTVVEGTALVNQVRNIYQLVTNRRWQDTTDEKVLREIEKILARQGIPDLPEKMRALSERLETVRAKYLGEPDPSLTEFIPYLDPTEWPIVSDNYAKIVAERKKSHTIAAGFGLAKTSSIDQALADRPKLQAFHDKRGAVGQTVIRGIVAMFLVPVDEVQDIAEAMVDLAARERFLKAHPDNPRWSARRNRFAAFMRSAGLSFIFAAMRLAPFVHVSVDTANRYSHMLYNVFAVPFGMALSKNDESERIRSVVNELQKAFSMPGTGFGLGEANAEALRQALQRNPKYIGLFERYALRIRKSTVPEHKIEYIMSTLVRMQEIMTLRPVFDVPVNRAQADAWVNAYPSAEQALARKLVDNIRYVGQEEFEAVLDGTVRDFNAKMQGKPYVAFIPVSNGERSENWVYQLARGKGLYPPARVVKYLAGSYYYYADDPDRKFTDFDKVMEETGARDIAFFNDASYSGNQMLKQVEGVAQWDDVADINVHFIIPFVSETAEMIMTTDLKERHPWIKEVFLHEHRTMQVLGDIFKGENFDNATGLRKAIKKRLQLPMHYFQAKVPNDVSLPFYVLGGSVVDESGTIVNEIPFIPGVVPPYSQDFIADTYRRLYRSIEHKKTPWQVYPAETAAIPSAGSHIVPKVAMAAPALSSEQQERERRITALIEEIATAVAAPAAGVSFGGPNAAALKQALQEEKNESRIAEFEEAVSQVKNTADRKLKVGKIIDLLKKIRELTPLRPLVDLPLDTAKAGEWVQAHDDENERELAQFLLDHITYIKQEEFEDALAETISDFNEKNGDKPYILLIPQWKGERSENWVFQIAKEKGLRPPALVINIGEEKINWDSKDYEEVEKGIYKSVEDIMASGIHDIVAMDDASYSGLRLKNLVDGVLFRMYNLPAFGPENKVNLHFVVPYMTERAEEIMFRKPFTSDEQYRGIVNNSTIYRHRRLDSLYDLLSPRKGRNGERYSTTLDNMKVLNAYRLQRYVTLTYFQHKLPDDASFLRSVSEGKVYSNGYVVKEIPFFPEMVPPYDKNYLEYIEKLLLAANDTGPAQSGSSKRTAGIWAIFGIPFFKSSKALKGREEGNEGFNQRAKQIDALVQKIETAVAAPEAGVSFGKSNAEALLQILQNNPVYIDEIRKDVERIRNAGGVNEKVDSIMQLLTKLEQIMPLRPLLDVHINKEKADEWIDAQPPADRELARALVDNIDYIGEEEFEAELEKTIKDFNEKMQGKPYILFIPALKGNRSEDWVFRMAKEKGLYAPARIIRFYGVSDHYYQTYFFYDDKPNEVYSDVNAMFPVSEIHDIAFIDDAVYSANQMFARMDENIRFRFEKGLDVHFVVPFVSVGAEQRLTTEIKDKYPWINNTYLYQHRTLKILKDILGGINLQYPSELAKEIRGSLRLSLVYFQHKVPDDSSIPWTVIKGSVYEDAGKGTARRPFMPQYDPPYDKNYLNDIRERLDRYFKEQTQNPGSFGFTLAKPSSIDQALADRPKLQAFHDKQGAVGQAVIRGIVAMFLVPAYEVQDIAEAMVDPAARERFLKAHPDNPRWSARRNRFAAFMRSVGLSFIFAAMRLAPFVHVSVDTANRYAHTLFNVIAVPLGFGLARSDDRADETVTSIALLAQEMSSIEQNYKDWNAINNELLHYALRQIDSDAHDYLHNGDNSGLVERYFTYLALMAGILHSQSWLSPTTDVSPVRARGMLHEGISYERGDMSPEAIEEYLKKRFGGDAFLLFRNIDILLFDMVMAFGREYKNIGFDVSEKLPEPARKSLNKAITASAGTSRGSGRVYFIDESEIPAGKLRTVAAKEDAIAVVVYAAHDTVVPDDMVKLLAKQKPSIALFTVYAPSAFMKAIDTPFQASAVNVRGRLTREAGAAFISMAKARWRGGNIDSYTYWFLSSLYGTRISRKMDTNMAPLEKEILTAATVEGRLSGLDKKYATLQVMVRSMTMEDPFLEGARLIIEKKIEQHIELLTSKEVRGPPAEDTIGQYRQAIDEYRTLLKHAVYLRWAAAVHNNDVDVLKETVEKHLSENINRLTEPVTTAQGKTFPQSLVFTSGMASVKTILHYIVNNRPATEEVRILTGNNIYYEIEELEKDISNTPLKIDRVSEHKNDDIIRLVGSGEYSALFLDPVSNAAIRPRSEADKGFHLDTEDIPVADFKTLIKRLTGPELQYKHPFYFVIDTSLFGPGFQLKEYLDGLTIPANLHFIMYSSLQKLHQDGQELSSGGFVTAVSGDQKGNSRVIEGMKASREVTGSEPDLFSYLSLDAVIDPEDIRTRTSVITSNAAAFAAFVEGEMKLLNKPSHAVLHPALESHDGHRTWLENGRPGVPFVMLHLEDYKALRRFAGALSKNLMAAGLPAEERNSFGFSTFAYSIYFDKTDKAALRFSIPPYNTAEMQLLEETFRDTYREFYGSSPKKKGDSEQGSPVKRTPEKESLVGLIIKAVREVFATRAGISKRTAGIGAIFGILMAAIGTPAAKKGDDENYITWLPSDAAVKRGRGGKALQQAGNENIEEQNGRKSGAAGKTVIEAFGFGLSRGDDRADDRADEAVAELVALQKEMIKLRKGYSYWHRVNRKLLDHAIEAIGDDILAARDSDTAGLQRRFSEYVALLTGIVHSQAWLSPTYNESPARERGALQGNEYPALYERETLKPKTIEERLNDRFRGYESLLFKNTNILLHDMVLSFLKGDYNIGFHVSGNLPDEVRNALDSIIPPLKKERDGRDNVYFIDESDYASGRMADLLAKQGMTTVVVYAAHELKVPKELIRDLRKAHVSLLTVYAPSAFMKTADIPLPVSLVVAQTSMIAGIKDIMPSMAAVRERGGNIDSYTNWALYLSYGEDISRFLDVSRAPARTAAFNADTIGGQLTGLKEKYAALQKSVRALAGGTPLMRRTIRIIEAEIERQSEAVPALPFSGTPDEEDVVRYQRAIVEYRTLLKHTVYLEWLAAVRHDDVQNRKEAIAERLADRIDGMTGSSRASLIFNSGMASMKTILQYLIDNQRPAGGEVNILLGNSIYIESDDFEKDFANAGVRMTRVREQDTDTVVRAVGSGKYTALFMDPVSNAVVPPNSYFPGNYQLVTEDIPVADLKAIIGGLAQLRYDKPFYFAIDVSLFGSDFQLKEYLQGLRLPGNLHFILYGSLQKLHQDGQELSAGGFATVVSADQTIRERLAETMRGIGTEPDLLSYLSLGAVMDHEGYNKELEERTDRIMSNAAEFAAFLQPLYRKPGEVIHPSLASHPGHDAWLRNGGKPGLPFVLLRLEHNEAALRRFMNIFARYMKEAGLPVEVRASFGFSTLTYAYYFPDSKAPVLRISIPPYDAAEMALLKDAYSKAYRKFYGFSGNKKTDSGLMPVLIQSVEAAARSVQTLFNIPDVQLVPAESGSVQRTLLEILTKTAKLRDQIKELSPENKNWHRVNRELLRYVLGRIERDILNGTITDKAALERTYYEIVMLVTNIVHSQSWLSPTDNLSLVRERGMLQGDDNLAAYERVDFEPKALENHLNRNFKGYRSLLFKNINILLYDMVLALLKENNDLRFDVSKNVPESVKRNFEKAIKFSSKVSAGGRTIFFADESDIASGNIMAAVNEREVAAVVVYATHRVELPKKLSDLLRKKHINLFTIYTSTAFMGTTDVSFPVSLLVAQTPFDQEARSLFRAMRTARDKGGSMDSYTDWFLSLSYGKDISRYLDENTAPAAHEVFTGKTIAGQMDGLDRKYLRLQKTVDEVSVHSPLMQEALNIVRARIERQVEFLRSPASKKVPTADTIDRFKEALVEYRTLLKHVVYLQWVSLSSDQAGSEGKEAVAKELSDKIDRLTLPVTDLQGTEYPQSTMVFNSGMASIKTILHFILNNQQNENAELKILTGNNLYYEIEDLERDIPNTVLRVSRVREQNTDEVRKQIESGEYTALLLDPVSNAVVRPASAAQQGYHLDTEDMPVADIKTIIEQMTKMEFKRPFYFAIDLSFFGPEFQLKEYLHGLELPENLHFILYGSLQKLHQGGQELSAGGFATIISRSRISHDDVVTALRTSRAVIGTEPDLFSYLSLNATVDNEELIARNSRIMRNAENFAGIVADEMALLQKEGHEVIHPAVGTHPGHKTWLGIGKLGVPFVLLRLKDFETMMDFTAVFAENMKKAGLPVADRTSFGFSTLAYNAFFPSSEASTLRISIPSYNGEEMKILEETFRETYREFFNKEREQAKRKNAGDDNDKLPAADGAGSSKRTAAGLIGSVLGILMTAVGFPTTKKGDAKKYVSDLSRGMVGEFIKDDVLYPGFGELAPAYLVRSGEMFKILEITPKTGDEGEEVWIRIELLDRNTARGTGTIRWIRVTSDRGSVAALGKLRFPVSVQMTGLPAAPEKTGSHERKVIAVAVAQKVSADLVRKVFDSLKQDPRFKAEDWVLSVNGVADMADDEAQIEALQSLAKENKVPVRIEKLPAVYSREVSAKVARDSGRDIRKVRFVAMRMAGFSGNSYGEIVRQQNERGLFSYLTPSEILDIWYQQSADLHLKHHKDPEIDEIADELLQTSVDLTKEKIRESEVGAVGKDLIIVGSPDIVRSLDALHGTDVWTEYEPNTPQFSFFSAAPEPALPADAGTAKVKLSEEAALDEVIARLPEFPPESIQVGEVYVNGEKKEIVVILGKHNSDKTVALTKEYVEQQLKDFMTASDWAFVIEEGSLKMRETQYLRDKANLWYIPVLENPIVDMFSGPVLREVRLALGIPLVTILYHTMTKILLFGNQEYYYQQMSAIAQHFNEDVYDLVDSLQQQVLEKGPFHDAVQDMRIHEAQLKITNDMTVPNIKAVVKKSEEKKLLFYMGAGHWDAMQKAFPKARWTTYEPKGTVENAPSAPKRQRDITAGKANIEKVMKMFPGMQGEFEWNDEPHFGFGRKRSGRYYVAKGTPYEILKIKKISDDEVWVRVKATGDRDARKAGGLKPVRKGQKFWVVISSDPNMLLSLNTDGYDTGRTAAGNIRVAHIVRPGEFKESIGRFGQAPGIEHVWYTGLPEDYAGDRMPVGKVDLNGREADVFEDRMENGRVFYVNLAGVPDADAALVEAAAQFSSYVSGTDNVPGTRKNFAFDMVVDHTGSIKKVRSAFSRAGINKPAFVQSDELAGRDLNAVLWRRNIRHTAAAADLKGNKILKIDDTIVDKRTGAKLDSWKEFLRSLDVFKAAGAGQLLVDWSIFRKKALGDKKLSRLLKFAKQKKVLVHTAYTADGKTKVSDLLDLYDLGFVSIGLDLKGVTEEKAKELLKGLEGRPLLYVKAPDGVSLPSVTSLETLTPQMVENRQFKTDAVFDAELPQFTGHEALTRYLQNLPAEATIIFHSQDVEDLVRAIRDVTDQKALVSFLNILVNLTEAKIDTPEKARRRGYNWPVQNLPVLSDGQVMALLEGKLEGSGLAPDSAIREQAEELTQPGVQAAFLTAIAEQMLIRDLLLAGNDQALGQEYAKGGFKILDPRLKTLLGSAAAKKVRMSKEELAADGGAAAEIEKNSKALFGSLLAGLSREMAAEKPRPGTVSAVIDIILLSLAADYNLERSAKKKQEPFDATTVKRLLAAA